jgi:hypothetical protein
MAARNFARCHLTDSESLSLIRREVQMIGIIDKVSDFRRNIDTGYGPRYRIKRVRINGADRERNVRDAWAGLLSML